MTTTTDQRMPRGHTISALSLAVRWAKLEHNMTRIASVLAVATALFLSAYGDSNTNVSRQRGGAYTQDKNTCTYAGT